MDALPGWDHALEIDAQAAKIPGNLSNTTMVLELSRLPDLFWDNVAEGAIDVRITQSDGLTEEPRHIVHFNKTAKTGQVNVFGSSLSAAGTTYGIHFGNSGASEPAVGASYGQYNTYRPAILGQYNSEATATLIDSTSNANNGSSTGTKTLEAGLFGSNAIGYGSEVVSNYNIGDQSIENAISIFLMAKPSDVSTRLFSAKWAGSVLKAYHFWMSPDSKIACNLSSNGTSDTFFEGDTVLTPDVWQSFAFTWSNASNNIKLYLDGDQDGSTGTFSSALYNSSGGIYIGSQQAPSSAINFQGVMESIFIFTEEVSADEMKVISNQHLDQSTFWVIEEVVTFVPKLMIF